MFLDRLHKGPQVQIGKKQRELTDVLAYYKIGTFLIEAKCLSVIEAGHDSKQDRKIRRIKKHVKKAIRQLAGACKAIQRSEIITNTNGERLEIGPTIVPHCIVLVSELINSTDWSDVVDSMLAAALNTGGIFHVLDLREFVTLLKISANKKENFDYYLMQRFEILVEKKSIHIRSRPVP